MADREWPPIILYGVIINQAIESGDKEVMMATQTVSRFMMERMGRADVEDELMEDWRKAAAALDEALG